MRLSSIEQFAALTAILAAAFGVVKFYFQLVRSNRQKADDSRWRKAALAREIRDELFKDHLSRSALRMLDWDVRNYDDNEGTALLITADEVASGLRTVDLRFTNEEKFVRDCFERLYDMTDNIEHFIRSNLLIAEDVMNPLRYYAERIASNYSVHSQFWDSYGYDLTKGFFDRFNSRN